MIARVPDRPDRRDRRPAARSTSPFSLELKKRIDRWVGVPAALALRAARGAPRPFPEDVRHVVLAKLWGIGNLAMVLPYVAAARRRFPRARVTVLTLARNRALLAGQPGIDAVLAIRDGGLLAPIRDLARVVATLRRDPADLFVDFEQFLRIAGLVARVSGARFAVGFDTPGQHRAPLYDATVPLRGDRHMALGFAELVRRASIPTHGCASHEVAVLQDADARLVQKLPPGLPRPWIVLHPGSGDNFPGRRWPLARFAEAGVRLRAEHGGTLLLTGAPCEAPLVGELAARLARAGAGSVPLAGALDLPTLVALLARSDLLLSNDTGPVHLAAAVRTPVVAFFGPNSPRLYGPIGPDHRSLYRPTACSPCLRNESGKTSRCTLPVCIRRIPVEDALAAAAELLASPPVRNVVAAR